MDKRYRLILEMMRFNSGDPKRIQHFLKVYEFARLIGQMEEISNFDMEVLEAAAIVHDIGIKIALEKFGESSGKLQEEVGPPYAKALLEKIGYEDNVIERVAFLVGHHHTYDNIVGVDYQILVEADFLVNLHENNSSIKVVHQIYENIFVTKAGKSICQTMFNLDLKE